MFKAMIFDLNGTVLDDEALWEEAFKKVFEEYDASENFSSHTPGIGVSNNWELYQHQALELASEDVLVLRRKTIRHYVNEFGTHVPHVYRHGYQQLVEVLKEHQYLLALATSLDWDILQEISSIQNDLLEPFEVVVTGDEVSHKKPAPDIFLKALERLNGVSRHSIDVKECVVFEDSTAGIHAAKAAGMCAVYLPNELAESPVSIGASDLLVKNFAEPSILDYIFDRDR